MHKNFTQFKNSFQQFNLAISIFNNIHKNKIKINIINNKKYLKINIIEKGILYIWLNIYSNILLSKYHYKQQERRDKKEKYSHLQGMNENSFDNKSIL